MSKEGKNFLESIAHLDKMFEEYEEYTEVVSSSCTATSDSVNSHIDQFWIQAELEEAKERERALLNTAKVHFNDGNCV